MEIWISLFVHKDLIFLSDFDWFFIRPSLRRDVLWYTNVRLSVRPFHMSRSNLRTPWPIHFKFHRVIGIDGLTVCILYGEISNIHSRVMGLYLSNCRRFFVCRAVNWEPLGQFTSSFRIVIGIESYGLYTFWWNFNFSFQSYGTLFIKL